MQTARWQRGKRSWLALLLGLQLPGMALSPGDFISVSLMGLISLEPVTNPAMATAENQGSATELPAWQGKKGLLPSRENPLCHNLTPPWLP